MILWDKTKVYDRYVCGFQHPSVSVIVQSDDRDRDVALLRDLAAKMPAQATERRATLERHRLSELDDLAEILAVLVAALETAGSLPDLGHRIYPLSSGNGSAGRRADLLFIETAFPHYTLECFQFLRDSEPTESAGDFDGRMQKLASTSPPFFQTRTNNRHFIASARKLQLPATIVPGGMFLLGWGRRSRLLSSSSTERTSASSMDLSRDKATAQKFMKICDLPVGEQRVAVTVAEAVQAANDLGYPVVVKPRSRDGGIGVTTDLRDDASVRGAFTRARAEDTSVLVERHIRGREFRLLFANERFVSIHERVPAHVVGNGRDKIADLVTQENARRRQAPQTGFTNIPIIISDDTDRCLAASGLTRKSVPGEGVFVRLSTVPKVRNGGEARLVDKAIVHPDIVEAAAKAVRMFRLDIAGVDYIAPDCTRSWRESGGLITEVNAMPQVNRFGEFDVHAAVLEAALPEAGRVPAVLLADTSADAIPSVRRLAARAQASGLNLGVIADDAGQAAQLAAQVTVAASHDSLFSVLGDRRIDCILVLQDIDSLSANGLTLDHFDACVISAAADTDRMDMIGHPFSRPHFADHIILPHNAVAAAALEKTFGKTALIAYRDEGEMIDLILARFGVCSAAVTQPAGDRKAFPAIGEFTPEAASVEQIACKTAQE